jgi:hypothetical protein
VHQQQLGLGGRDSGRLTDVPVRPATDGRPRQAADHRPRPPRPEAEEHQTGSEPDTATRQPDEAVPGRPKGEPIRLRIVGVIQVREGEGADAGTGDRQVADHPADNCPENRDTPLRPELGYLDDEREDREGGEEEAGEQSVVEL